MVATKTDIRDSITSAIIAKLEAGVRPWSRPWSGEHAAGRITTPLRWNGERYRGINVLVLWLTAEAKGYTSPLWATFRQIKELGGCVKGGERATSVVYCDRITKDKDTDEERQIFFTRSYAVFCADQTIGLPDHYYAKTFPTLDPVQRIEGAEAFMKGTGAKIEHGGLSAHYSKLTDHIQMPPFEAFRDAEAYYGTACHELIHWSGHASRLNRELKSRKDRDAYSFEELTAEIGAAFLSADLNISSEPREDHAAYIGHWLDILRGDKTAIFKAAALAQKAADYLHSLQVSV